LIIHQPSHGFDGGIHALPFFFQAGLKRLPQLYGHASLVELLRQDQRRTGRDGPRPAGPFRSSRRVNAHDIHQFFLITRVVVRRFVYFRDLEAGLERCLERLRKICDVVLVRSQRLVTCLGLLVEVACHKQRLPAHFLICGLGR
jgi:hypothetical protein